jgi:hypothetical protein
MKGFEDKIIAQLQQATTSEEDFLALLAASQIVDSRELYVRAIRGLADLPIIVSKKEAEIMGIEAFYDITACKCGQFSD